MTATGRPDSAASDAGELGIDLAPYVDFDLDQCVASARRVNPGIEVLTLSATKGMGLDGWYAWLRSLQEA
jgi:Ni2+-binding GTPase involved in maturation of urease and hydrogenase